MFALLAQEFQDDFTTSSTASAGSAVGLFVMLAIYAAVIFVIIAGMWKVFTKAGQPGWYSIIPILNTYTLIKIARRPGWWLLLMFIPCVSFVVAIIVMMDLAKAFGKDSGFGIGLALLAPIFIPILASVPPPMTTGSTPTRRAMAEPAADMAEPAADSVALAPQAVGAARLRPAVSTQPEA